MTHPAHQHLGQAAGSHLEQQVVRLYKRCHGRTTIVDRNPVIVHPGLCKIGADCPSGTAYSAAVPADPADPTCTNWSKPSYNLIVNGTGDDPTSAAWQTKDVQQDGE